MQLHLNEAIHLNHELHPKEKNK